MAVIWCDFYTNMNIDTAKKRPKVRKSIKSSNFSKKNPWQIAAAGLSETHWKSEDAKVIKGVPKREKHKKVEAKEDNYALEGKKWTREKGRKASFSKY